MRTKSLENQMLTIHETTPEGVTQMWEMNVDKCPECGALCIVDLPRTPATPKRLLCCACSYSEGYDYSKS